MKTTTYFVSEFWGGNSIRKVRAPSKSIGAAKKYAARTQAGPHTVLQIEDAQGHCLADNKPGRGWVDFDIYGRAI